MKNLKKSILLAFCILSISCSYGQDYKTYSGTYQNRLEGAINCFCNVQAYLNFKASDGKVYNVTLCFDSEPGDFYQIFNNETITVEGYVSYKPCKDGNKYLVMDVVKTTTEPIQRQVIFFEFQKKKANTNNSSSKGGNTGSSNNASTKVLSGNFTLKGTTMDDWSEFDNCKLCGRFDSNPNIIVKFDKTDATEDDLYFSRLKVYGTQTGSVFQVTHWEKI